MHEISQHKDNSYITLTYDDNNMPPKCELQLSDWQKFMKRLRKQERGKKISYFHSGEYGSINNTKRPHYHAILFGHRFKDQVKLKTYNGNNLYTSQELNDLWPYGYHTIGEATFGSACYIARYVQKKVGKSTEEEDSLGLRPEYSTMSRNPAIGKRWFEKYKSEVYPSDEVISNGIASKPPKYYDLLLDKENPQLLKSIKKKREKDGSKLVPTKVKIGPNKYKTVLVNDNDSFRLPIKEICKQAKIAQNNKSYWR